LQSKRSILDLLIDEILFKILSGMRMRAAKKGMFRKSLIVPISDLIGQRIISTGRYEATQFDALSEILNSPRCEKEFGINLNGMFIDIGANIGLYTIALSSFFQKTLSLEASPTTYEILKLNVGLTGASNVLPLCLGASNQMRSATIYTPEGNLGWAKIVTDFTDERSSQEIRLDTLDNIVSSHELGDLPIGLVKIDVEGHELQVLEGASRILSEKRPTVLYEALDGEAARVCSRILRDNGYTHYYAFKRRLSLSGLARGFPIEFIQIDPNDTGRNTLICAVNNGAAESRAAFAAS